jgi:hypothetical protein
MVEMTEGLRGVLSLSLETLLNKQKQEGGMHAWAKEPSHTHILSAQPPRVF